MSYLIAEVETKFFNVLSQMQYAKERLKSTLFSRTTKNGHKFPKGSQQNHINSKVRKLIGVSSLILYIYKLFFSITNFYREILLLNSFLNGIGNLLLLA